MDPNALTIDGFSLDYYGKGEKFYQQRHLNNLKKKYIIFSKK